MPYRQLKLRYLYRIRTEWFDLTLSFNPAVHRIKQALFHGAVVPDLQAEPVPPPHPEVTKYMEAPKRVLKRSKPALEECIRLFDVKEGTQSSYFPCLTGLTTVLQFRLKCPKRKSK